MSLIYLLVPSATYRTEEGGKKVKYIFSVSSLIANHSRKFFQLTRNSNSPAKAEHSRTFLNMEISEYLTFGRASLSV